jgi:hypothetical protein
MDGHVISHSTDFSGYHDQHTRDGSCIGFAHTKGEQGVTALLMAEMNEALKVIDTLMMIFTLQCSHCQPQQSFLQENSP